jgi:hypothetical protein
MPWQCWLLPKCLLCGTLQCLVQRNFSRQTSCANNHTGSSTFSNYFIYFIYFIYFRYTDSTRKKAMAVRRRVRFLEVPWNEFSSCWAWRCLNALAEMGPVAADAISKAVVTWSLTMCNARDSWQVLRFSLVTSCDQSKDEQFHIYSEPPVLVMF